MTILRSIFTTESEGTLIPLVYSIKTGQSIFVFRGLFFFLATVHGKREVEKGRINLVSM